MLQIDFAGVFSKPCLLPFPVDSSIVVTCPSIPAARFAFCFCFIRFDMAVRDCFSGEPKQNQGQGWSTAN